MLSVVVNFYNNRREALATLHSLTRGYQQKAQDLPYEVIAVDNGSREPLTEAEVRAFGPEFSYRLYTVTGDYSDSSGGWFGWLFESGCFGIRKDDYFALGGFDERFQAPGGGLVNLDFFQRALSRPDLEYVLLLGEGTFHQVHGG